MGPSTYRTSTLQDTARIDQHVAAVLDDLPGLKLFDAKQPFLWLFIPMCSHNLVTKTHIFVQIVIISYFDEICQDLWRRRIAIWVSASDLGQPWVTLTTTAKLRAPRRIGSSRMGCRRHSQGTCFRTLCTMGGKVSQHWGSPRRSLPFKFTYKYRRSKGSFHSIPAQRQDQKC